LAPVVERSFDRRTIRTSPYNRNAIRPVRRATHQQNKKSDAGIRMSTTASRTLSKDDIVAAVADLIVEQGLSALTMRTIAAKLGCSVGTLPHYFKGKDEIVAATLNWSNERIMGRLNAMPPGELSVETLLPVVISSLPLDEQSDREWRIRLCLWDHGLTQPALRQTSNVSLAICRKASCWPATSTLESSLPRCFISQSACHSICCTSL
jgi:AcrR family transcriptional regulator